MSRLEGKFGDSGEEPVDAAEILKALAEDRSNCAERRRDAVTRYLSAGAGWQEASTQLGGAFAAKEPVVKGEEG